MTLLTPQSACSARTSAESRVAANFAANITALAITQPRLADSLRDTLQPQLTWLYARDGSLHGMHSNEKWFASCSIPLLAGRAVLKSLEPDNLTSCFLAPAHAGLLRAARERMGEEPALLAIAPELDVLRVILACHDFTEQITSHHLWFAAGADWPDALRELFDEQPGLPTPARFIRTKLVADEILDPMIAEAQRVFSAILAQRTRTLHAIRSTSSTAVDAQKILVIAGSRFRLWEDAATVLIEQLAPAAAGLSLDRFDSDDPATSSPAALASAACGCGAVVAANVSRADAVNLVAWETAWITWITRPLVPAFDTAGPRDALVLADPAWRSLATAAGWPLDRIDVAGWPDVALPDIASARVLAVIADTRRIAIPKSVDELSSHRVLWANIEAELRDDPLALDEAMEYLSGRAMRIGIDPDAVDRRRFIESLILPAYEQGCARLLIGAGLPLRMHGRGWEALDEFSAHAAGPLATRQALHAAAAAAAAIVYVWPKRHAHPIEALGRPIIHRLGKRRESFIREATLALNSATRPSSLPAAKSASLAATVLRLARAPAERS